MKKLKIKNLKQTCFACPSQWEGELSNGKIAYIRYRWGNLTFGYGDTLKDAINGKDSFVSIETDFGEFDGVMETEDMLKLLNLEVI